jgi:hypothetical protein
MRDILAVLSIAGFIAVSILCLLAAKFGQEWASKMMDTIVPMVVQCWIINFTTLFQFHYGTSSGSQRKTDELARIIKEIMVVKESNGEGIIQLTDEVKK